MLDSVDLKALHDAGKRFQKRRGAAREAEIARRGDQFGSCLSDNVADLPIRKPPQGRFHDQNNELWFGMFVLWASIDLFALLDLPILVLDVAVVAALGLMLSGVAHSLAGGSQSSPNMRHYVRGAGLMLLLSPVVIILALFSSEVAHALGAWDAAHIVETSLIFFPLAYGFGHLWIRATGPLLLRGPLYRGDYDAALRRVDRLAWLLPRFPFVEPTRATLLAQAGRYDAAYSAAKGTLMHAPATDFASQRIAVTVVIHCYLAQGHYDDALTAISCFLQEEAPYSPLPYRLLAEYYNRQDAQAERALAVTQVMVDFLRQPRFPVLQLTPDWALAMAVHAETLARNDRTEEARRIIGEMLNRTASMKPYLAQVHVHAGQVERCAGNPEAANQHFTTAHQLDPDGASGMRAGGILAQLKA